MVIITTSIDFLICLRDSGTTSRWERPRIPYRGAHGVMVVYDITDQVSFNNVKHWLQEIDRYCCDGTLSMVIGNKCDLVSQRVVDFNVAEEFCNSLGIPFYETSAKNATNVEEVFVSMSQAIRSNLATMNNMQGLGEGEALLRLEMLSDSLKKHIRELDLSYNDLRMFPKEILQMRSLNVLNLSNNKLQDIPTAICRLKALNILNLKGNPLPPSLISMDAFAIGKHFSKQACRSTILTVLMIHKYRRSSTTWIHLNRDVLLKILMQVWETRNNKELWLSDEYFEETGKSMKGFISQFPDNSNNKCCIM